eukprot:9492142-Pyramimonas_sp.AAC.1
MDHGFLRRRRREDAIAANLCTSWRLNKAGLYWIDSLKDLSNAFASPAWPAVDEAAQEMAMGRETSYCQQRYRLACTSIPAEGGDLLLKTGCGMLQGDPFAVL